MRRMDAVQKPLPTQGNQSTGQGTDFTGEALADAVLAVAQQDKKDTGAGISPHQATKENSERLISPLNDSELDGMLDAAFYAHAASQVAAKHAMPEVAPAVPASSFKSQLGQQMTLQFGLERDPSIAAITAVIKKFSHTQALLNEITENLKGKTFSSDPEKYPEEDKEQATLLHMIYMATITKPVKNSQGLTADQLLVQHFPVLAEATGVKQQSDIARHLSPQLAEKMIRVDSEVAEAMLSASDQTLEVFQATMLEAQKKFTLKELQQIQAAEAACTPGLFARAKDLFGK